MQILRNFILAMFALLMVGGCNDAPENKLAIMTSLPLVLGEASVEQVVKGENSPAPIYDILKENYDVTPLDSADDRLLQFDLLLLAQTRAYTPEEYVALDDWVQSGGALLILSDAALQWHSEYSLGDKRRPLFTSLLSPLFSHWGLEQILLIEDPEEHIITMGDYDISTVTPGEWIKKEAQNNKEAGNGKLRCSISANKFEADCSIGKGRVILIADSDFIHEDFWHGFGQSDNVSYLLDRLEALTAKP